MKFCQLLSIAAASMLLLLPAQGQPDASTSAHSLDPSTADPRLADFLIPGQYIVHFKNEGKLNAQQIWEAVSLAFEVEPVFLYLYTLHFQGVALGGLTEADVLTLLGHAMVNHVEQDARLVLDQVHKQPHPLNWGLDRIDHDYFNDGEGKPFNNEFRFAQDGHDVAVFLLDTGVYTSHSDFDLDKDPKKEEGSRIACAYSAFSPDHLQYDAPEGFVATSACDDAVGHGTFMAGIIGGTYAGVAKRSIIASVKVFDDEGNGSVASALAGLQYVQFIQNEADILNVIRQTVVVNMSFGTPIHLRAMDIATEMLYDSSVFLVASAGNTGSYACNHFPAGFHHVMAVGASTHEDTLASFSNHGSCVNLIAPGAQITSIWNRKTYDFITLSGTSAAAAHVTGVAALVLAQRPEAKPHGLVSMLKSMALALESLDTKPQTTTLLLNMAELVMDSKQ